MSCLAMSVGLGNVWRFHFIANENAGGVSLIPYLIVLVLIGWPVASLLTAAGPGHWRLSEGVAFRGVGYGKVVSVVS